MAARGPLQGISRSFALVVLASFTWLAAATGAGASVIYQYVGAPYLLVEDEPIPAGAYTTDMHITGRFEFAELLSPGVAQDDFEVLRYELSDGRVTLDESNSSLSFTNVDVDANGLITHVQFWAMSQAMNGVGSHGSQIVSTGGFNLEFASFAECIAEPCSSNEDFSSDFAQSFSSHAVGWSIIPEPSTGLLFGLGLLGLRGIRGVRR